MVELPEMVVPVRDVRAVDEDSRDDKVLPDVDEKLLLEVCLQLIYFSFTSLLTKMFAPN